MKTYLQTQFLIMILVLVMLPQSSISAQEDRVRSLSHGTEAFLISSPTNQTDYLIFVNLPSGYDNSENHYPVLYLFDPLYTFGTVTDQLKLLRFGDEIPEIIVVGVSYPAMLDLGGDSDRQALDEIGRLRMRDMAPGEQPELFLEFLTGTLIPYIDKTYRTDTDDRAIMGHSFGGDFVLYALFNGQGKFHRFVSSSPGTGPPNGNICVSCELEEHAEISGILFLSAGESDGNAPRFMADAHENLQAHAGTNLNLRVSSEVFEGTTHLSVVPFALGRGLQTIYCDRNTAGQCGLKSLERIDTIDDADFSDGRTFKTPDATMTFKSYPSRYAERSGACRNMEATVVQAIQYANGTIWIQLDCGDNLGWIPKTQLQQ